MNTNWAEPLDFQNSSHVEASDTMMRFSLGWFANPILADGDYPSIMKELVGTIVFINHFTNASSNNLDI